MCAGDKYVSLNEIRSKIGQGVAGSPDYDDSPLHTIKYADGKPRGFYQIGLSANKTGISVYILGLEDKTYLSATYGKDLGKASVTGYCIRFKTLKDINIDVLEAAMRYGLEGQNEELK